MIRDGADVITGNKVHNKSSALNHPETDLTSPRKNCFPQNPSLVPKGWGTASADEQFILGEEASRTDMRGEVMSSKWAD